MKRTLLMIALVIAASSLSFGQTTANSTSRTGQSGTAEQEIGALNREWINAVINRDAAATERILADDFTNTEANGAVTTKAQILAAYKTPQNPNMGKLEAIEATNGKLQVYGDMAVLTALVTTRGRNKEQPFSDSSRMTIVYVKRQGRWQPVAAQSTRVARQTPPPRQPTQRQPQ